MRTADEWLNALEQGDECPDLDQGIHHFSEARSQMVRCPYYGKQYPEDHVLDHYLRILTREGFGYSVKVCDVQKPTSLKIYCLSTTQVGMFQSSNRYTLPVFVNRAVDVPRPNLAAPFPPHLVHEQYPVLVRGDVDEMEDFNNANYMGRQRSVYKNAISAVKRGEDVKVREGAINKLDETLYVRAIARDDFLDNDPTTGTSWKIRQRIVQSSNPIVTAQINKEIHKITKRLIRDWKKIFVINNHRVLMVYASKMTQHEMRKLIFDLFELLGGEVDVISLCAGDDSLIGVLGDDGEIWFLEADCSHMDASEWEEAMEFNYRCYSRLGMSSYALFLLRRQDSGPRLYTHPEGVVIVSTPGGQPIKNTGSNATSIGNTLSAQAIVHNTMLLWNGDVRTLKQCYRNAATTLNFVVKVSCAPWSKRFPTFLKNVLTPAGFVLEPGIVVKMGKTLTDPRVACKDKDYVRAWRKMIHAMARCYRFYFVDLVVDAMLRYYERIGIASDVKVSLEHYLLKNVPSGPGGVYREYDIYERYHLTREDIDGCIKMIDSCNTPFVIFSHHVFDRLGAVAYG